ATPPIHVSSTRWRHGPVRTPAAQWPAPHGVLDVLRDAILQHRFLAADFLQRQFAAFVVQFLEAIEAVAAVAHHFAGLADVTKLLGKLEQSNFGADDLLFS